MTLRLLAVTAVILGSSAPLAVEGSPDVERQSFALRCTADSGDAGVLTTIAKTEDSFSVKVTAEGQREVLVVPEQRPSLNVRVNEQADVLAEFVDFADRGLEVVPVDGPRRLELDLGAAPRRLSYAFEGTQASFTCTFDAVALQKFLGILPTDRVRTKGVKAVAFDIDDTLLFTSPAFARGFATGGVPKPDDVLFWTATNGCDAGCETETITLPDGSTKELPANAASSTKAKALELIKRHRDLGHRVYAITARPDINGDPLRAYVEQTLGIAPADVFFEPDMDQAGNPAGKTDRIEALELDVFYGDSDSDISDAHKARVHAVRFLRSPASSNRKAGKLNKYHPGYYGEPILSDSY